MYELMDITDRISEPPLWWLNGIPRYYEYHPHHSRRAYTEILVRIARSVCNRNFDISVSANEKLGPGLMDMQTGFVFWDAYENPPFHLDPSGFNCAGNHGGVEALEVLHAWSRADYMENWVRKPELEGPARQT